MSSRNSAIQEFQKIPGVGIKVAQDLWNLGYRQNCDLQGEDPQSMYERLCTLQETQVDRCMLYVFRCAVYFTETKQPKPELLRWWNWKDK